MKNYDAQYDAILKEYPEIITKEQLYKLCHVSKKTAQHYLENGLIPCVSSGKKTRKYEIKTADVVVFLKARDENPLDYTAPEGWYIGQKHGLPKRLSPQMCVHLKKVMKMILPFYPDVLTIKQVSELTGYSTKTIHTWCNAQKLKYFDISGKYMIPKIVLFKYLTENDYKAINGQAYKHILALASALKEVDECDDFHSIL